MIGTRVLKKHKQAVLQSLADNANESDPEVLALRVASAVLDAYDHQMRYTVVTSDNIAFGPYATSDAAHKAIAKGLCAFHTGTKAMVLPTKPVPTRASNLGGSQPARLAGQQLELSLELNGEGSHLEQQPA